MEHLDATGRPILIGDIVRGQYTTLWEGDGMVVELCTRKLYREAQKAWVDAPWANVDTFKNGKPTGKIGRALCAWLTVKE